MPESSTTLSLTAALATPTMTPMEMPLQPTDVYISVLVPVTILLCGCIVCGIVCCCCAQRIRFRRREPERMRGRMNYLQAMPVPQRILGHSSTSRARTLSASAQYSTREPSPFLEPLEAPQWRYLAGYLSLERELSTSRERLPGPFWEFPTERHAFPARVPRRFHEFGYSSLERTSRADERKLNMLCLIGFGIKELTIHQRGGTYPLGNGDATLIVDEGTVEMETVVRYAVNLHGPFVYSAGYKPASVVVYLNLEGANLLKPLKLMLKHWCKPVEVSGEAVLKLLRAPHTTGEMENFRYTFDEVQGNFLHSTATFTISEPQYLYCVEMKVESQASYNAIPFQMSLPEDDLVKFRIQLVYDSREWNARLMETLEKEGWKNTNKGDPVPKFFFLDKQITAAPHESHGRGWQANIHGHQSVRESDFLEILGKAHPVVLADIKDGRYPPCIYYKVLYTSAAERRRVPGLLKAELHGADVNLFFTCKVFEEQVPPDELNLTTAMYVATAGLGSNGKRKAQHCSDSSRHMSTWNDAALVSLKDRLKQNLSMNSGLSDKLEKAAGGFCSRYEAQGITGLSSNNEQIDRVIETLRGKANEDFHTFCTMLRETNNGVWADELEKKAVWHKQQGGEG